MLHFEVVLEQLLLLIEPCDEQMHDFPDSVDRAENAAKIPQQVKHVVDGAPMEDLSLAQLQLKVLQVRYKLSIGNFRCIGIGLQDVQEVGDVLPWEDLHALDIIGELVVLELNDHAHLLI